MDHTLRYTYHISDDYFEWLKDNGVDATKFMGNKENGHYRPTFFCYPDEKNPDILWMVPLSTQYQKFAQQKAKDDAKYRNNVKIVLGKYDGEDAAFLIQNAFPALQKHIDHVHTRLGNPVPVPTETADDVCSKMKTFRQLRKNGIKIGFIDIEAIEKLLLQELAASKNTQSEVESKKLEQKLQDEHKAENIDTLTSSDNLIIAKIKKCESKRKEFEDLMAGRDVPGVKDPYSRLLNTLAYFSNCDKNAMERIFKNSKLYDGNENKLKICIKAITDTFLGSGSGGGAGSGAAKGRGNGGDNYR